MATLKVSVIFPSGARLGPGKARLLQSIRDTGSISAAARGMGMSYKQAWLLLDSLNQSFGEPLVAASAGGRRGGGAALTGFGAEVLERYMRIVRAAEGAAADDLDALERAQSASGPATLR